MKKILALLLFVHTSMLFSCDEFETEKYKPFIEKRKDSTSLFLPSKIDDHKISEAYFMLMEKSGEKSLLSVRMKLTNMIDLDDKLKNYHHANLFAAEEVLRNVVVAVSYAQDSGNNDSFYLCKIFRKIKLKNYLDDSKHKVKEK